MSLDLKAVAYSLPVLGLGALYYVFSFRSTSNQKYFDQVSENIRSGLVRVSGFDDDPNKFTWQKLRGIFYPIVDKDPSLSTKARLAYFNGYMWTTVADIRALSGLFALISLAIGVVLFVISKDLNGLISAALFFVIFLLSYPASSALTKKHIEIGTEQIEIIEHNHQAEVKQRLGRL